MLINTFVLIKNMMLYLYFSQNVVILINLYKNKLNITDISNFVVYKSYIHIFI